MGSILKNASVIQTRRFSARQKEYWGSIKSTSRRPRTKHEQSIQKQLRDWFVENFPGEHFVSDTGSGAFGKWAKEEHSRQQSHKGEPDINIRAARRGYHGLLLELKREGFELRMKRDGRKVRVYHDSAGRIIEHDYKIRKKGDWCSVHVERQAQNLQDYCRKGYYANFAIGLEMAKKFICWYFDVPYQEAVQNQQLF